MNQTNNGDIPAYTVQRIGNLYNDFMPEPWPVPDVRILYDKDNKPKGYYCTKGAYSHEQPIYCLPDEIFNHQLKTLDVHNPDEVAKFMCKYGMIYHSTPEAEMQMGVYNETITSKLFEPTLIANRYLDAISYDATRDTFALVNTDYIGLGGRSNTVSLWFDAYRGLDSLGKNVDKYEPKYFLVSCREVESCIEMMMESVKLAKALAQSENPREIENMMGWDLDFSDTADWYDAYINAHLTNIHPKIGLTYDGIGNKTTLDYDHWSEDYEHSFDDKRLYRGSFAKALALQIRDFNLHLNESRQCKECGETFVKKQSPRKTSSRTRSNSDFCCDKCKNKNAARAYRKSDGYRLKQEKKKQETNKSPNKST